MPQDDALIASARETNAPYLASDARRIAAEIVGMLPEARDDARRVLAVVHAILSSSEALADAQPPPPAGETASERDAP